MGPRERFAPPRLASLARLRSRRPGVHDTSRGADAAPLEHPSRSGVMGPRERFAPPRLASLARLRSRRLGISDRHRPCFDGAEA
jgi:hypothetical protein